MGRQLERLIRLGNDICNKVLAVRALGNAFNDIDDKKEPFDLHQDVSVSQSRRSEYDGVQSRIVAHNNMWMIHSFVWLNNASIELAGQVSEMMNRVEHHVHSLTILKSHSSSFSVGLLSMISVCYKGRSSSSFIIIWADADWFMLMTIIDLSTLYALETSCSSFSKIQVRKKTFKLEKFELNEYLQKYIILHSNRWMNTYYFLEATLLRPCPKMT